MTNTVFDDLAAMTVHIVTNAGTGTGFLFREDRDGQPALLLITNRHVLKDATTAAIEIGYGDPTKPRPPGQVYKLQLRELQTGVIFHDSLDLAAVGIAPALAMMVALGYQPYMKCLGFNNFADDESEFGLAQDVFMLGYPRGIADTFNNRPIVRRGITATSYSLDYEGRPEFVIDAACFPGSSGSPVVVANDGTFFERNGDIMTGRRFRFLGVLWGGPTITAKGELRPEPIPMATQLAVHTNVMMNLGFCIKARAVRAFIEGILRR